MNSQIKKLLLSLSTLCELQSTLLLEISKLLKELGEENSTENQSSSPTPQTPETYYSIKEASKLLSVSETTIRRLIKSGNLKATRLGKKILIPSSEIMSLKNKKI